jgi:hypothetical protein
VTVQDGKLTLKGGGASWGYALTNPPQGSVAVRVQLGSQPAFCAVFPAKTSGKPPSSTSWDKLDKFVGMPNAPAPASCPPVP